MRRSARTDLCGGRSAMIVPTATAKFPNRARRNRATCASLEHPPGDAQAYFGEAMGVIDGVKRSQLR
jgi:hypothetical protein